MSTDATAKSTGGTANDGEFPFEKALAELEALIEEMESGNLGLEDSLVAFERGVRLTRQCQQALTQAEQRVNLLMSGQDDDGELVPFADAGEKTRADL